jgi:hypothetical protein
MEHIAINQDISPPVRELAYNPLILGDFMSALQRLFRIGVYYPSGHAILDQAMDRFLALLAALAQERHFVRLEDDGRDILLEKVRIERAQPFAAECRRMMTSLSIIAIEINRDISREDLLLFVKRMIACRSLCTNAKQFASIEITDLPASVSITFRQFLASESDSKDGRLDDAARNLNAFYESLAGHGLTEEQIAQCRLLLDSLSDRMEGISLTSSNMPSVHWDDVAFLLAQAFKGKPLKTGTSSQGDLNMLASILSNLEKETEDRNSREAINLLVSLIRKPVVWEEDEKKGDDFSSGLGIQSLPKMTAAQLQEFTDKNRLNSAILLRIQEISTEEETLSVLLQIAGYRQSLQNQTRMGQFFIDIIAATPTVRTWEILIRGLLAIVKTGDRANLTVAIRLITEPLRRLQQGDSLALFLKSLRLCQGEEETLLWPYAVNEMLLCGFSGNIETYRKLCLRLSGLSWGNMLKTLPILQGLEAFQQRQIATDIFSDMSPSCYQLYAFLLNTSIGPKIEGYVVAGLRNSPADKLIQAVAPLLDPLIYEHKEFLDSYLRHPQKKEPSDRLKIMAGTIIVEKLTQLPREQRGQAWVPETIGAMAEYQGAGCKELLREIMTNKRLFVVPEWPAACRRSAQLADKKLRRRPRITKASGR